MWNTIAYTNSHSYGNGHSYCYGHSYANSNRYSDADRDCSTYSNCSPDARRSDSLECNQCDRHYLHRKLEQRSQCDRLPARCSHEQFLYQLRNRISKP